MQPRDERSVGLVSWRLGMGGAIAAWPKDETLLGFEELWAARNARRRRAPAAGRGDDGKQ